MATAARPEPSAAPPTPPPPGLLRRIRQRIPGNDAFDRRRTQVIADDEAALLTKLREIIPSVAGDPDQIRFTDEGLKILFITNSARLRFWRREFGDWFLWLFAASVVVSTIAGTFIAKLMWHIHQPPAIWFAAAIGIVAIVGGCILVMNIQDKLFGGFAEAALGETIETGVMFGFPLLYLFVVLIVVHYLRVISPRSMLTFAASVGAFELILIVASFCLWLLSFLLLLRIVERQTWEAHPSTFLFQAVLDLYPLHVWSFQQLIGTTKLLASIEKVAYLLEGPMARRLQSGDPQTQGWLEDEMRRKAVAVREWKKLAIYAGGEIPELFQHKLRMTLLHICNLDWKLLDEMPVPVVSKRERARLFGQRLLKAATVSVIPAAILIARLSLNTVQQFDKTNVVLIGTVAWLCINLLSAFDPDYGLTKQGLDLLSKVPGVGGGRGRESPGA